MGSNTSAVRPLRIAVCASAFGFGPASKAAAILSRLSCDRTVEAVTLVSSISYEFLAREGYGRGPQVDIRNNDPKELIGLYEQIDLALVVLTPDWIPMLSGRAPVIYVDSLGFMWPKSHYDAHPYLRNVDAYVVQDVFGAAERVRGSGVRNVQAVGALTPPADYANRVSEPVIHFGGGINVFSTEDGVLYAEFAARLLRGIAHPATCILTSQAVQDAAPEVGSFSMQTLPHAQTYSCFTRARLVFTSPGMTALLELAATGAPTIPLPPQNLSQAVIVREMASLNGVGPIWRFLADAYKVKRDMPEEEGVAHVRALNRYYASSKRFCSSFREMVRAEATAPRPLPPKLVSNFGGLDDVAMLVHNLIGNA